MEKDQAYIFYDGECPLCNGAVRFLVHADKKRKFKFGPLNGQTARKMLPHPLPDTLVFVEKGRIYLEGRGVFRIFLHLPFPYKMFGIFSFFPPFLFNWIYRMVANRRNRLFTKAKMLAETELEGRLLP